MDPCPGTITVEYYDGSSDFSESDESECPNPQENSLSNSNSSSSSNQTIRDSISCKTYDFKHANTENDFNDHDRRDGEGIRKEMFTEAARQAMYSHFQITHNEHIESLMHPIASFPRCPRGDIPEQYGRRKHPGPFLTCSFSHSHECGDDFMQIQIPTKPTPEFHTFTRPQHLKERKAKFFKQCKHCESISFTHHRNPARHYEDYLNNVTYKQHNDHAKVWQQHLVDLMYLMDEDPNSYTVFADADVEEKCKPYKPSDAIVKATRYQRNIRRRIPTVITRKRTVIARPLRRPLPKPNASRISSLTNDTTRATPSLPERKSASDSDSKKVLHETSHYSSRQLDTTEISGRRNRIKSNENRLLSIRRSGSRDIDIDGRKQSALHQRLKASVSRLINSRQASSRISKRFVTKPEPTKEAKYIQRGKPNISAKFLRARSKNKVLDSSNKSRSSNLASRTTSRSKGRSSIKSRNLRRAQNRRPFGTRRMQSNAIDLKDESSDDGSYAQYRDQNGEFDVEKYRQSILKMLSLSHNAENGTTDKKRKLRKSTHSNQANFVSLPKIRNVYRNVKPKITSNFCQRKRKHARKLKHSGEFDGEIPSDLSFKSTFWNEDSLASKNSLTNGAHDL